MKDIIEKIKALPESGSWLYISGEPFTRIKGLTTNDLQTLVTVIEEAEKALTIYGDKDNWGDFESGSGDVEKEIVWCGASDRDDERGHELALETLSRIRQLITST